MSGARELAQQVLLALLRQAETEEAGLRTRKPAVALTDKTYAAYRQASTLEDKEVVDGFLNAARVECAVELKWDGHAVGEGFITRVILRDYVALARFLGQPVRSQVLLDAEALLAPFTSNFPALTQVLRRWRALKTVRGHGPDTAAQFAEAARALQYVKARDAEAEDLRLRVASMQVFGTSKHLERLAPFIDVVRSASLDEEVTPATDLWAELGLVKDPQPALFAGKVRLRRQRLCDYPDVPYVGLPPAAVLGIEGEVNRLLTVENLTNFHAEAARVCEEPTLVLYSAGMPSPAWRAMYRRLLASLPDGTAVAHWGDLDEGGLRISAKIAAEAQAVGRMLQAHRMHPLDIDMVYRVMAPTAKLNRMSAWARKAGWSRLAEEISQHGVMFEQEAQL